MIRKHSHIISIFIFTVFFQIQAYGQFENEKIKTNDLLSKKVDTATINEQIRSALKVRFNNPHLSFTKISSALNSSRIISYNDGIAKSYLALSILNLISGNYIRAEQFLKFAKPYCLNSKSKKHQLIATLYNQYASLYGNQGLFDSSLMYNYATLSILDKYRIQDTALLLFTYTNIANKLVADKKSTEGNYYLNKALSIALQSNNTSILSKIFVIKCLNFGIQNKFDSCKFYGIKTIELAKELGDSITLYDAYFLLGKCNYEEKNIKKAITYFEEIIFKQSSPQLFQLSKAYNGLGDCYFDLEKYELAKDCYTKAMVICKKIKKIDGLMDSYASLVETFSKTKDFKNAFLYQKKYNNIKDSFQNQERIKYANNLEIKFRSSEKDKAIAFQKLELIEQEKTIQNKNVWIIIISSLTLIIGGIAYYYNKVKKEKTNLKLIQLKKEREIAQLKAIMEGEELERERIARDLHDGVIVLFSTVSMQLNSLMKKNGMADHNECEHLLTQLELATKELRKAAHNLMPDVLLQEGLEGAIHYFCKNLSLSQDTIIDIQFVGNFPTIKPEYELLIYRITQELMHNVIKYARAHNVLIQFTSQKELISILVEDDGIGIEEKSNNNLGTGLFGIKKRIQSLHGTFNIKSEKNHGTSVYIELETENLKLTQKLEI